MKKWSSLTGHGDRKVGRHNLYFYFCFQLKYKPDKAWDRYYFYCFDSTWFQHIVIMFTSGEFCVIEEISAGSENHAARFKLLWRLLMSMTNNARDQHGMRPWNWSNSRNWGARSIQPKFPEISVQNSMDRFDPTGKVSKKRVHLLRWTTFPGRTGWNFGWMDRAHGFS